MRPSGSGRPSLYGACCVKLYIDFFSLSRAGRDDLRGARDRAPPSRRNLVFGRSARDLDHDARMRIIVSSALIFLSGWRAIPGTIAATSQLDWLISMTAMRVLA